MDQGLNPAPLVELLYDGKAQLAEGPFFEPETNQLLWVDINACTINILSMEGTENRSIQLAEKVGFVIPVEGSKNLLAGTGRKLCFVNRETGAVMEKLVQVEEGNPNNRFNDAKCDAVGRLWVGTLCTENAPPGVIIRNRASLYCYDKGRMSLCVPDVSISNGIGWNEDSTKMYYIDSLPRKVYSFDYHLETGVIGNQSVLCDYASDHSLGFPDGMCTDIEGRLWVASFGGGCVTAWDPITGGELLRINIPGARNVTSCCFGGPNHSWLFVTSASSFVKDLSAEPNAGGIFVIKNLGTNGLPASKFRPTMLSSV